MSLQGGTIHEICPSGVCKICCGKLKMNQLHQGFQILGGGGTRELLVVVSDVGVQRNVFACQLFLQVCGGKAIETRQIVVAYGKGS